MSSHQNSKDIDSTTAGRDQTGNSSGSPAPSWMPETSPAAQRSQPQANSPAEKDDDDARSDASSDSVARQLAVEEHEEHLREQVRIERDAQDRETAWRRRTQTESPNPQPQQTTSQPPPLIIGAPLGRNLTAIEATTRLVSQWEAIHEATLQSTTPEAASPILEELIQARNQLAALTAQQQQQASSSSLSAFPFEGETQNPIATPLNSLEAHKSAVIASRIELLTESLEDSHFPPERANIAAAVSLYRAARIPYSANWALLYAGHLVDFAPTYASFTADRAARLDRYARLHGEGWLWIEPPLAREPGGPTFFSARRGTFLPENDTSYDMGHYSVTMSFRRMKNLVYRGGPGAHVSSKRKRDRLARSRDDDDDEGIIKHPETWPAYFSDDEDPDASDTSSAHCAGTEPGARLRANRPSRHPHMARDRDAPTLHFRLLLDSGATLPLIYDRDARALGIRRDTYAAVSCIRVETASPDAVSAWLYEMQVSVVDTRTCAPLVSPASPVWPGEEPALGGVTLVMTRPAPGPEATFSSPAGGARGPVAETVGGRTTFLGEARRLIDEAEGRDYGRLSGLLPFKVCYVQATPGLRTVWMGEDRRDVLGAQRMPGQMRWAPGTGRVCDPGHPRDLWKSVCGGDGGRPALLRMAHEEGALADGGQGVRMVDVEEKGWKGRSEVLVVDGDGVREKHIIEPRRLVRQRQAKRHKKDC